MTKRRNRGDGGLHWDETRQRWIATVTVGYTPAGKRIVRKASGRTKTDAKSSLKDLVRDYEDGLAIEANDYTVEKAVRDWLQYGLNGRDAKTLEKLTILADRHVIPDLGARKLKTSGGTNARNRNLTAEDVDKWLADKAKTLSTRTLRDIRAILRRAISRAQARDKVKRNVVLLCEVPVGQAGRPLKALTLSQAEALLIAAEQDKSGMGAYIVTSLVSGARTEEMRPLTWDHVDLKGNPKADPPVPPHVMVWRSVRIGGDTKTRKSRRSVAVPPRCVAELTAHQERQQLLRRAAGETWSESELVFASATGSQLDAANVRRAFRRIAKRAGLKGAEWTPRELRHSFVSLLSDSGVPLEQISRLVGHSGTSVTEAVYRHQIRPVVEDGATAMDKLFPDSAA